ncbi:helix-turn-helix domain-containing protein [Cupriavidus sp. P-10]|uniref:hypothetical protein n=1 Tax=Cupriavidus sp. P-10 TaxID=2027911 RepID=UPI000EEBEBB2|nr:hypothetical protein [Cupriavidus sp. P-10]BDB27232.1 helix-turn-helix domain-containing protein [Cupriavidus sp. P-10]
MGRVSPVMTLLAFAPPIEEWPTPPTLGWSSQKRELFAHRVAALTDYVDGVKTGIQIQRETTINRCLYSGLLRKCLETAPDGQIFGFRALEPHKHHKRYTRTTPVKGKPSNNRGHYAGALQYVLRQEPRLETDLIQFLKQRVEICSGNPEAFRKGLIYAEFIRLLYVHKVDTEWPENTNDKGRKTLYKWFDEIIATTPGLLVATQSDLARTRSQTGTGETSLLQFFEPFYAVEIDAHKIQALTTIMFNDGIEEIDVILPRWWILAVVESRSTAVWAHLPVFSSEVRASDVQELIKLAFGTPQTPNGFPEPYQRFAPGAGFPNVLIPALSGAVPSLVLFDNALAHLARAIHMETRKIFGFSICYGSPHTPSTRHNIEHLFDRYADGVSHQLPSSTGNRPDKRPSVAEENALRLRIRADEVAHLSGNFFANYNVTPKATIPGLSPMQLLQRAFAGNAPSALPRHLPTYQKELADVLSVHAVHTVKGNNEKGIHPYIQHESCRYSSPKLANSYWLRGKKIDCLERGGRHLDLYYQGNLFDRVTVQGKWSGFEHSIRDRKAILSAVRSKELSLVGRTNYMQAYHEMLVDRLKTTKDPKRQKRAALELLRLESAEYFRDKHKEGKKNKQKVTPPTTPRFTNRTGILNGERSWKIRNR